MARKTKRHEAGVHSSFAGRIAFRMCVFCRSGLWRCRCHDLCVASTFASLCPAAGLCRAAASLYGASAGLCRATGLRSATAATDVI